MGTGVLLVGVSFHAEAFPGCPLRCSSKPSARDGRGLEPASGKVGPRMESRASLM